jgi:hypothetical protein
MTMKGAAPDKPDRPFARTRALADAAVSALRLVLSFASICCAAPLAAAEAPLRLSVYATSGDVQRYLAAGDQRGRVVEVCQALHVSRIFLEGRRGDEYVAPAVLQEVRDFLASKGIQSAGGIATVPGQQFGARQNGGLTWLDWESKRTRQDVAAFFTQHAPLFEELIVDDFYCTADTSPAAERARGNRSWGEYRRDLLVSLIDPLIVRPARGAQPDARLIIKFPQWYDRFHLFGYDPRRMIPLFDQVWVGTEVRDPKTRRMGFVQPTEGYMNFRWLASIGGDKVRGAWFDHIDCSAQNFFDQASQSVLAGARELTLFRLGDLMEPHPGDARLAGRWSELQDLGRRVQGRRRAGLVFYKPPVSDAEENLYLADYLGMIGLPVLPEATYPDSAQVVVLAVQAAADPDILSRARRHLDRGATLVLTPAFVRRVGVGAGELAGVEVAGASRLARAQAGLAGSAEIPLPTPLEVDASLAARSSETLLRARVEEGWAPLLTRRRHGQGRVFVLNVHTFTEQDFRDAREWLLAPKPLGLSSLPQAIADPLRQALLGPLGVRLQAPAGVSLCLFEDGACFYNFLNEPVTVVLHEQRLDIGANGWLWHTLPQTENRRRE